MRFGELEIRCGPCGPRRQVTEFADLKMPGAIEAVDGVLAQVDGGTVTAGEAIELVLNAQIALRNNGARSLPGNMPASVDWRRAGGPAALVERRATRWLVNRASRPLVVVPCRAQRGKGRRAQRARFFVPGRLVGEGGREGWIDRPPCAALWPGSPEVVVAAARGPCVATSLGEPELVGLLEDLAVRPRWGVEEGAKTLSDAARLVWEGFGGDTGAIWRDASTAEVEKTLQEIHGIGTGIASMATRILRDDFGCFRGQERQIDVKPDIHLVRVFQRLGITDTDSENEAILAARRLNREFPGELDWPAWRIGKEWCHPRKPNCAQCWMTDHCPKRL